MLNHFTAGIYGTVLEYLQVPECFSSPQPKLCWNRKEVKCCEVVLSPQHSQSPIPLWGDLPGRDPRLPGTPVRVLRNRRVQGTSVFPALSDA